MMKKSNLKPFVAGCIIAAMVLSSTAAFAETTRSIQGIFGRITLMVSGQKVNQETLLYDGVTYVPIRAAAEALGMEVTYDGANELAYLDPPGTNRTVESAPSTATAAQEKYEANIAQLDEEFIQRMLNETREDYRLYILNLHMESFVRSYLRCVEENDVFAMREYAWMTEQLRDKVDDALSNRGLCLEEQHRSMYVDYISMYDYLSGAFLRTAEAIELEAKGMTAMAAEEYDYAKAFFARMIELNNGLITKTAKWPDVPHGTDLAAMLEQVVK